MNATQLTTLTTLAALNPLDRAAAEAHARAYLRAGSTQPAPTTITCKLARPCVVPAAPF